MIAVSTRRTITNFGCCSSRTAIRLIGTLQVTVNSWTQESFSFAIDICSCNDQCKQLSSVIVKGYYNKFYQNHKARRCSRRRKFQTDKMRFCLRLLQLYYVGHRQSIANMCRQLYKKIFFPCNQFHQLWSSRSRASIAHDSWNCWTLKKNKLVSQTTYQQRKQHNFSEFCRHIVSKYIVKYLMLILFVLNS